MAEANDPDPLPVEYISFGSYNTNLVKFYFNCSFSFATPDAVYDTTDHPLLARDVPASIDLRNCMWLHFQLSKKNTTNQLNLAHSSSLSLSLSFVCIFVCHLGNSTSVLVTKCAYYAISDNDYKNFVKISDIKNSQPDGFILRIILYIQGARDGHILLATSNHPNFERDFVYEFGKFNFRHNFQVAKIY